MARKPDVSQYESFDQITERLSGIVDAVRDRDLSLESSLDLFDEAIALGSKAVEMVDATNLSEAEKAQLDAGVEVEAEAEVKVEAEAEATDEAEVEATTETEALSDEA